MAEINNIQMVMNVSMLMSHFKCSSEINMEAVLRMYVYLEKIFTLGWCLTEFNQELIRDDSSSMNGNGFMLM